MNGFFRLDRDLCRRLAQDKSLTIKEFRVLMALLAATRNPGDVVDAATAGLTAATGLARSTVQEARHALASKGYIRNDGADGCRPQVVAEVPASAGSRCPRARAGAGYIHIKETRDTVDASGSMGELDWESYAPDPVFAQLAAAMAAEGGN